MAFARQRWNYALIGVALALGAPGGLLLLRSVVAGELPQPEWVVAQVVREPLLYAYLLVSSAVAFALFGFALGRRTERLSELSVSDPLTGLLNARVLAERLAAECARASRYGEPLSLILIDVDALKELNDSKGHAAGDLALRAVASAVRDCSRSSDIASRWGGDEFSVIAPNTPLGPAEHMAERIRSLAAQAAHSAGAAVTVSAGLTTWAAGECSPELLRKSADAALYEAKRAGRNCVRARECGRDAEDPV